MVVARCGACCGRVHVGAESATVAICSIVITYSIVAMYPGCCGVPRDAIHSAIHPSPAIITMLRSLAILLVLVLAGETCRVHAVTVPRLVSKLALKNAAFLDLVSVPGFSPALAATTFTGNPFVGGAVDVIEDIASVKNLSSAKLTQLTTKMNWPNDVTAVPEGAVEGFAGLSVGYGFLVPGKSIGGVGLVSYPDGAFTKITKDDGNPLNGVRRPALLGVAGRSTYLWGVVCVCGHVRFTGVLLPQSCVDGHG